MGQTTRQYVRSSLLNTPPSCYLQCHYLVMKTENGVVIIVQVLTVFVLFPQRGLNIAAFCKDFNARTAHYIEGVPLPCRISVKSDRSYELTIHNPPSTFFLKQAAGIQRGAMSPGKCAWNSISHMERIVFFYVSFCCVVLYF